MLWEASYKFCQEEEKASGSLSSSREKRIRIGSSSQWIITLAILRPVQWCRPSTNTRSKDSLMHHKKACCCMLLWNLGSVQERPGARGFQKARTATNICFHLLSQATFSALSDKSPLQSGTASIKKITEAVMFIKKKFYKTACKETWSVAKPVRRDWLRWSHRIFLTGKSPPVSFKAESQHKLSTRPGIPEADVARAFQTFLQFGTSANGGISPSSYQVTYLLGGRIECTSLRCQ